MKKDERMETLCEEFSGLEESEKDYILGVSQTLAHSNKGTKPVPIAELMRAIPEYKSSMKENLV